jgi:hypothetical protein
MIVWLEWSRCRRIGFVLVAAAGIVEQGGNDRQQHDHDDADDGDPRNQELDEGHISIMTRQAVKNIYLRSAVAEKDLSYGDFPGLRRLVRIAR